MTHNNASSNFKLLIGSAIASTALYGNFCLNNQQKKYIDIEKTAIESEEPQCLVEESTSPVLSGDLICSMEKSDLDKAEVIEYIINNFSEFHENEVINLIKKSEKVSEAIKQHFIDTMFMYPSLLTWKNITTFFPHENEQNSIFKAALEKHLEIPFSTNGPYTQSEAHIIAHYTKKNDNSASYKAPYIFLDIMREESPTHEYFSLLKKILQNERTFMQQEPDIILLYHALRPEILWTKIVKTAFYAIKYNRPMHNFLLVGHENNRDPHFNGLSYYAGKTKRRTLLIEGVLPELDQFGQLIDIEKDIHYTNGPILGNTTTSAGASTWWYLTKNFNQTEDIFTVKHIAQQFGINLSDNLATELEQCKAKFLEKAKKSFLLRWRIPSAIAEKAVYTAHTYGIKKSVWLKYNLRPSSPAEILQAMRKDPLCIWDWPDIGRLVGLPDHADSIEYCIPLTPDTTVMFQKKGVKVDILSINDHKDLEKCTEELIAIVKKIKEKYPEHMTATCSHEEEIKRYRN